MQRQVILYPKVRLSSAYDLPTIYVAWMILSTYLTLTHCFIDIIDQYDEGDICHDQFDVLA